MTTRLALATAFAVLTLSAPMASGALLTLPIPGDPRPTRVPAYVGSPAAPDPDWAPSPPQHPFMADNKGNNIHNDAYMSDTYRTTGPLGVAPTKRSTHQLGECASLAFDRQNRLETVCVSVSAITLKLFDPVTLRELASYSLPGRPLSLETFSDFSGGGYFYLDDQDRAVVPTSTNHILVIEQTEAPGFAVAHDYDLTAHVPAGDKIVSNIPAWSGEIFFVTTGGTVGTIAKNGSVRTTDLGEPIANSLAADQDGGVYVVTTRALYRMDVGPSHEPTVTWSAAYPNGGTTKPGQVSAGSGTTPTVMSGGLVAITDNAEPRMNVVVYRTAKRPDGRREVCRVPVFEDGASATENSLIASGRSLVVTNNYGYKGAVKTINGRLTEPGVARVDVSSDRRSCRTVWTNTEERSPSAVPKLSLANGLVYMVGKDPTPNAMDVYYLTTLDFRTGRLVYKYLYGTGPLYNPNYAPVTLGPDGSAYVGVIDGLVRIADATPPEVSPPVPSLRLRVEGRDSEERVAVLQGADVEWIREVAFMVGATEVTTVRKPPFSAVVKQPGKIVAKVVMVDGTRVDATVRG